MIAHLKSQGKPYQVIDPKNMHTKYKHCTFCTSDSMMKFQFANRCTERCKTLHSLTIWDIRRQVNITADNYLGFFTRECQKQQGYHKISIIFCKKIDKPIINVYTIYICCVNSRNVYVHIPCLMNWHDKFQSQKRKSKQYSMKLLYSANSQQNIMQELT